MLEKTLETPWTARRSDLSILRKSVLDIHWKDWCWSRKSKALALWCEELTHLKRSWCWERWRQEKGITEDEMIGWHHLLNGHEFDGFRELVMDWEAWPPAVHGVTKSLTQVSDWVEQKKHSQNDNKRFQRLMQIALKVNKHKIHYQRQLNIFKTCPF